MLNLLALDVANAAKTVIGIGGLIFVHELGHFLVGRWCGVRAEAFSIGFGPVLAKWQPGETEYRLSAIPLGGYVKFLGENPDERGELDPRSFHAATYPRKVAIMLAGVTMNVIAAFLLFVCAFQSGVEVVAPVVGALTPGHPAEKAGLLPGDRFVTINGHRILDFSDVIQETVLAEEVEVVVERNGAPAPAVRIQPSWSDELGHRLMGVQPARDDSGDVAVLPGAAGSAPVPDGLVRVVAVGGEPVAKLSEAMARHLASPGPNARWTFEKDGARVDLDLPVRVWRIGIGVPAGTDGGEGLVVSTDGDAATRSAARDAGLPARARILTADGAAVATIDDLRRAVTAAGDAGREVVLRWRPVDGGDETETRVRPVRGERPEDLSLYVPPLRETVREENVFSAAVLGVDRTHRWVLRILSTLRSLVTGGVSADKLQGPLKLAKATYETADTGWQYLFLFLGMISMNLAVLNVLPVPLLDGGQLAILTVEKVRGRPLPERVLEGIQWTGLALLLSFMVFVIVNDIRNF